jgi:hypothetical protein
VIPFLFLASFTKVLIMRWLRLISSWRSFVALAALLPMLAAVGCGGSKSTVTGDVTLDGKPLPMGNITFVPAKGGTGGGGEPIKDGKYTIKVVPGDYKVTVETDSIGQRMQELKQQVAGPGRDVTAGMSDADKKRMKTEMGGHQMEGADELKTKLKELQDGYKPIPPRYRDANTSGFSVTVTGNQEFSVPLKSK